MKPELAILLKDFPKRLENTEKVQKMVIHNLGYYLQSHSSYAICKKYFRDFDFRSDYWWRPEVRLLGKYYIDYFNEDFFPPVELRKVLLQIFSLAKKLRREGAFDFVPGNTAYYEDGAHPGVFKKIGEVLGKAIESSGIDSKAVRDAHPRSFKGAKSISEHLAGFVRTFSANKKESEMNGTLIHRFRFLPYYLASSADELKQATAFLSAFYTLYTATNAYQTGAAQNFGPILGNNSTKQFIDVVGKWMDGESISKTKFMAHDSESKELQDKSEYVAVLEVHGFARLHQIPYVNNVVLKNYVKLFDLENLDWKTVQERVGQAVREFLKSDAKLVNQLAQLWEKYIKVAKETFELHFEPEKIQRAKLREQYGPELISDFLLEEYKKQVDGIGKNLGELDKAQALVHLCLDANAYLEVEAEGAQANAVVSTGVHYWSIGAGEGAQFWPKWQSQNLISLGWEEMGDLTQYKTLEELKKKYIELYQPKTDDPKNDTLGLFEFRNNLKPGDIVFVKNGRKKLLGVGRVLSEYQFVGNAEFHGHLRSVEWLKTGEWDLQTDKFAIKSLTDITEYPDFVQNLLKLANVDGALALRGDHMAKEIKVPVSKNVIFWGPPGTGKTYRLIKMQADFRDSSSGSDELVAWIQELGWWDVIAAALIDLDKPVTVPELFRHEFVQLKAKQQSTNKTPKNTLWGLLQQHTVADSKTVNFERRQEPLVVDKSVDSKWSLAGDWKEQLDDLVEEVKKIRSGKSDTVNERFRVVTFHQSYSYEEFVEGIRPERTSDGTGVSYQVKDGVFKLLCQRAIENPDKEYAIFIDEINRGNISKIFGELITLIEEDKRLGAPHEITLTLPYSGKKFGVPKNLYVFGTMNSVDRSIALVDMALRRRFEFVSIRPNSELISQTPLGGANVRAIFEKINQKIAVILGTEYQIGHSYFMGRNVESISTLKQTWFGSILPLLQEYLFDDWDKIEALVGEFVKKTEVSGLDKLALPRFSFGSFVDCEMSDEKFSDLFKKLE
jgi:hypothetical protein